MSKGLGKLQRVVLATLDVARSRMTHYTGCIYDELRYHGRSLELPDGVYDMRASLQYLARLNGKTWPITRGRRSTSTSAAFSAAFCRAVRGLVRAGYLEQWSAPVYRTTPAGVGAWANRRFCKRTEKARVWLLSSDMYNAYGGASHD